MVVKTKQRIFGMLLCCIGLWAYAAPLPNLRIVTTTPRATISALHGLHALTPQQPVIADMIRSVNRESLSAGKRSMLEQYDPKFFHLQPDVEALSNRIWSDLIVYQKERGLAQTGVFDVLTAKHLLQDDVDNQGLALASRAVADDRKIAILRQDTSNGLLWRISIEGQPDVRLASLDLLSDELNSTSGARPVVFAAATDNLGINKIQSSLRLSGVRTARPVPIVLSGEPKDNLALLRPERLDVAGMVHQLSVAQNFKQDKAHYRQVNIRNAAGASLTLSLWASSKQKLLRLAYVFVEFAAMQHPQSESLAELAARFRDYLFDRGYDFTDAGIAFGTSEPLTRQWAIFPLRRFAPLS